MIKFREGLCTLLSEVCQSDKGKAGGSQRRRKEVRTEGREGRREGGKRGQGTEERGREGRKVREREGACVTGET